MGVSIREFLGVNSFDERTDGTKMTFEEKYSAVVNAIGLDTCVAYLPATKEEIKKALEADEHLNTIPLTNWEHLGFNKRFAEIGITLTTLSDIVCVLKRAAKMYANQED